MRAELGAVGIDKQNPWPGLSAFDEGAQEFFNGRDDESAELSRVTVQAPLTVLFGKSGLGKTSLIQAGLFPRLRQRGIVPIYIRLNVRDRTAPLIEQAATALAGEIRKHGVDAAGPAAGERLWEHLHGRDVRWWSPRNQPLTPLFVFDQFEEVFTLGPENAAAIADFCLDLADLIENRIPTRLAERLESGAPAESLDLSAQRYKVLLSFREDFLPEVESWKHQIPSLMRNRLRLLPMRADRALQVVSGETPAGRTHELVTVETAREVVAFVAAAQARDDGSGSKRRAPARDIATWETLEIEPALLSLICSGLNKKRRARSLAVIDVGLLREAGEAIIGDFYRQCVIDIPDRTRRFIEDALITERGFRNSYPLQDALEQGVLNDELLRRLVDRRLLRVDHQFGTDRVELIHDRLTDVVREHRDLERERLRVRRQRQLRWLAASTMALLVIIGGVFFYLWQSSRRDRDVALGEQKKAEAQKKLADDRKAIAEAAVKTAEESRSHADAAAAAAVQALNATARAKAAEQRAADSARAALREAVGGKLTLESTAIFEGHRTATPDLAMLLAAAAYRLTPGVDAAENLQSLVNKTEAMRTIVSFADPVIGISRDGRAAVTGSQRSDVIAMFGTETEPVVRLWDALTGRPRGASLAGFHEMPSIAFTADGKILATATSLSFSDPVTVRLWNTETGQPRSGPLHLPAAKNALPGVLKFPAKIAISPDGNLVVCSSLDGSLRRLDVGTGQERGRPMVGHTGLVESVQFSPDGKSLISVAGDKTIRVWDAASGTLRGEPIAAASGTILAVSDDGKMAVASEGQRTRLLDLSGARESGVVLPTNSVTTIAFQRGGKNVVSGHGDGSLRFWDAVSGKEIAARIQAHAGRVRVIASLDDQELISAGADRTLRVWDLPGSNARHASTQKHTRRVDTVLVSPDGSTVLSSGGDATIRLWDARTGAALGSPISAGEVRTAAFGNDRKTVVALIRGGNFRVWDIGVRESPRELLNPPAPLGRDYAMVTLSPDGRTLLAGPTERELRLIDLGTGGTLCEFSVQSGGGGLGNSIVNVAFSPDGKALVTTNLLRVVLVDTAGCKRRPTGFRLDGFQILSRAAISPDGRLVAAGNRLSPGSVYLWDAQTGALRVELKGHTASVSALSFSPDGKTLVSAAAGELRLWDVATAHSLGSPMTGASITSVTFGTDGKTIYTGDVEGAVRMWDSADAWIDRVCAKLTRNLTANEWKQYAGNTPYVAQCPGLPLP